MRELSIIGLMSGTSADGIDAAVLQTDGQRFTRTACSGHFDYQQTTRDAIRAACIDPGGVLADGDARARLELAIAADHARAVEAISAGYNGRIDLIGFHGQTIYHNADNRTSHPLGRQTIQLGDAAYLANNSGIDVIYNFREADMKNGGQGAPFAPIYHAAIFRSMRLLWPAVLVNIGGVANLTFVAGDDPGDIIGFDTGPGNALIDDFMRHYCGADCDRDGALAATGKVNQDLLYRWMQQPFFARKWPKSLDRQNFAALLKDPQLGQLSANDAVATVTALTAHSIAHAISMLPAMPKTVFVAGGGRRNPTLMTMLNEQVPVSVVTGKTSGFDADMLEAELMAFLAARSHFGLPLSFPKTTGCRVPVCGGQLAAAR